MQLYARYRAMWRKAWLLGCFGLVVLGGACATAQQFAGPERLGAHVPSPMGFVHGAQYWVNPGATLDSIREDFRRMAAEDQFTAARLAFWTIPVGHEPDWTLWDACFEAAESQGVWLNPVLPYYPGWVTGGADDPENQKVFRDHVQMLVGRYKDEPMLALWTVDIEPSRAWKLKPSEHTLALYRDWLKGRYPDEETFLEKHTHCTSIEEAVPVTARSAGPWNNFQPLNDWQTFTAWALAEQTLRTVGYVREVDPNHPTSCTPPDVLHNQLIENGRSMWWLADTVDCPGSQMQAHWHLETADMPEDALIAQACSIRKVACSGRGRATYVGEVTAGPDLGESFRLYAPTDRELVGTALCHLAEGAKGYFFWLWNPLMHGPIAGGWGLRNPDGSATARAVALRPVGGMIREHQALLSRLEPRDTHVAILDTLDAQAYLYRRSHHHPMSEWYVMNQYGLFKALRSQQMGCDFIDERALLEGEALDYRVIYVPFSLTMSEEIAAALTDYTAAGGVIVCDAMTAFSKSGGIPFIEQPGAGLKDVLGIVPGPFEVLGDGWTEVTARQVEPYFDRFQNPKIWLGATELEPRNGAPEGLAAVKLLQPAAEAAGSEVLYADARGRPVVTLHAYGDGQAVWTGTLLGLAARPADAPRERLDAIASLFGRFVPEKSWEFRCDAPRVVCRRLGDGKDEVFVLFNEGDRAAEFYLRPNSRGTAAELLYPGDCSWQQTDSGRIRGTLAAMKGAVIHIAGTDD